MRENIYKKTIVIVVIAIFLSLAIAPTMGTVNQKSDENLTDQYEKSTVNIWETYELLIISPVEFEKELKPLVDHKEKVGISTKLVTLDEIYNGSYSPVQGRDNPEKIKYFIKSAIEEWEIKYVLLVGDFRHIPVRYVYNEDVNEGFYEPCFISELYYADIYDKNGSFSSWDTDGDGVYGEWIDDGVSKEAEDKDIDLYPDVYVGRLACRNNIEVKTMVDKIITYETYTYSEEWFNRIVAVAGDTYPKNASRPEIEGEENAEKVLDNMSGFEHIRLYTSTGNLTGSKDVVNAINNGCGFIYFDGHANPMVWSTHAPRNTSWVEGLSTVTMSSLHNKNMLPICVAGACHNAELDVTPMNLVKGMLKDGFHYFSSNPKDLGDFWLYTWIPECWAWKLTSEIGGGSIATIANTGLGMTKEDKQSGQGAGDYMDLQFFYEYGTNGTGVLGDAWGKAITRYLDKYPINWDTPAAWDSAYDAKTVQEWTLLGDPSLRIGGYPS